jgi:hypothetical protein
MLASARSMQKRPHITGFLFASLAWMADVSIFGAHLMVASQTFFPKFRLNIMVSSRFLPLKNNN